MVLHGSEDKTICFFSRCGFDETTSYLPVSSKSTTTPLEPFSSDVESSERGSTNSQNEIAPVQQNEIAQVKQNEAIFRRSTNM